MTVLNDRISILRLLDLPAKSWISSSSMLTSSGLEIKGSEKDANGTLTIRRKGGRPNPADALTQKHPHRASSCDESRLVFSLRMRSGCSISASISASICVDISLLINSTAGRICRRRVCGSYLKCLRPYRRCRIGCLRLSCIDNVIEC